MVARVVAVDTSQFRVISQSVKKTDPHDARLLSFYLSKNLLPEVRMKHKDLAQLASLTQTRDTLVKQRSALKNKVNNILSARGLNLAKEVLCSEKKLAEVLELSFDEIVRTELRLIVEQIRSPDKSIAELEKTIGEESANRKATKSVKHQRNRQDYGRDSTERDRDVNDFADDGRLASYFGIVPRVSNSNETERSGRIHKRGTKLERTALVQSALIAANYSPYLKRCYEQVEGAAGSRQGDHRTGAEVFGHHLPDVKEQVDIRGLPQLRIGGGVMKTLGNPPPGIQVSGSHCAVRRRACGRTTVLGGKGSLRRGKHRRALASCAPFCTRTNHDGRLRREPDAAQYLRLAKAENQVVFDKTS